MREILFKAKRVDSGEWVEFYSIIQLRDIDGNVVAVAIIPSGTIASRLESLVDVIPETVCQFIGKRDRNGRRIFDGDEVACHKHGVVTEEHIRGFVKWGEYTMQFPEYDHNGYYNGHGPYFDNEHIYERMLVEDVILTGRNIHETTGEIK